LLRDTQKQTELSTQGKLSSQKYDWQVVAEQILTVYEMAMAGNEKVGLNSDNRFWSRR
jgi:phosphatidylinositol alpha-mannosyltransferase